jgi:hypothetical protein
MKSSIRVFWFYHPTFGDISYIFVSTHFTHSTHYIYIQYIPTTPTQPSCLSEGTQMPTVWNSRGMELAIYYKIFCLNNTTGREWMGAEISKHTPSWCCGGFYLYRYDIYIYTYLEVLRINANLNHQRRGWSSQQHTANNDDDDDLNFIWQRFQQWQEQRFFLVS